MTSQALVSLATPAMSMPAAVEHLPWRRTPAHPLHPPSPHSRLHIRRRQLTSQAQLRSSSSSSNSSSSSSSASTLFLLSSP
ncbi:hypothetical protein IAQ61_005536 [Plenodomus lingam]|uniref:uncharacterized protein n=1 Tax=Leptosphaeria maculans TaxID=5022 RepID=UPI003319355E|nr:hypothetical protein IAQ61_005536 [Plenodomus lingam]